MNLASLLCRTIAKATGFGAVFPSEGGTRSAQGVVSSARTQAEVPDAHEGQEQHAAQKDHQRTGTTREQWNAIVADVIANTPDDWGRADKELLRALEEGRI